jgi:hypothetical protein
MLKVARETPRDQQKRALETLTEFLELDTVGDPLHKVTTLLESVCKYTHSLHHRRRNSKSAKNY